MKALGIAIVRTARSGRDQRDRRFVAGLGLTGHIADGLVEQNRDPRALLIGCRTRECDSLAREDLRAELGHALAVDKHEAAFDVAVGLAPRAQTLCRHQF